MRPVGLLIRHSTTLAGSLLIAGIYVWLALSARAPGLNLWSDLVTGLSSASLYTGTVAAGFSAFEANRWSAAAADRLRGSARNRILVRVQHATAVILPLLLGYVLALFVLGIFAAASGTYGSPFIPWLLAFGAALLLAATFGYVVGRAIGARWYVAPAAALLFYGLFVLIRVAPLPFWTKSLYPVITNTDSVFVYHISATMWGQVAFFIGLGAALIVVASYRSKAGVAVTTVAGFVVCALLIVSGASTVAGTGGQYTTGHNPRDFVCQKGSATVCVNRGYASALPQLERQFQQLNARAAGTPLVATRLEQNVEGIGDAPQQGARSVYVEQVGSPMDMAFAAFRYAIKYGGTRSCQSMGADESSLAVAYVDSWLSGYTTDTGDLPGIDHYRALTALPTRQANAWFQAHQPAYFSCTLKLADLP